MNKKIFAAVFSAVLLCSCGKENIEEQSETGSESVSLASGSASGTTVTTTGLETASETVSEETKIAAEVSEAKEKSPITRDFFNDDVVFEEIMLPVKVTSYHNDGTEIYSSTFEYDAAGNESKFDEFTYEYDYNPDGTYNSVSEYENGKLTIKLFYNQKGYCTGESPTEDKYEFDDNGQLIRKENDSGFVEYSYDENGRLYETYDKAFGHVSFHRYEYGSGFENVYRIDEDSGEQILYHIMEKDENGNTIKEIYNVGDVSDYAKGKAFAEYKYDSMNRLIYENHTVSDDFDDGTDMISVYLRTYEYEGDNLKKETFYYLGHKETTEYFYDENGRIVKKIYFLGGYEYKFIFRIMEYFYNEDRTTISQTYTADGVLIEEAKYAMIPKIVTDIEYKDFYDAEPMEQTNYYL